jgi:hypothetical protein
VRPPRSDLSAVALVTIMPQIGSFARDAADAGVPPNA